MSTPIHSAATPGSSAKYAVKTPAALERPAAAAPVATGPDRALSGAPAAAVELSVTSETRAGTHVIQAQMSFHATKHGLLLLLSLKACDICIT